MGSHLWQFKDLASFNIDDITTYEISTARLAPIRFVNHNFVRNFDLDKMMAGRARLLSWTTLLA